MNTFEFLRIPSQIVPEREALVDEGRRYSFSQLEGLAIRLAAGFQRLGVGPGHVVAVTDRKSDRYVLAYYAVSLLGATFVPLNYRVRHDEMVHLLSLSRAQTIVAGANYQELAATAAQAANIAAQFVSFDQPSEGWLSFDELLLPDGNLEPASVGDEDVNLIIFTSGTTRKPKGVLLRYSDVANAVLSSAYPPSEDGHCAQLLVAPFHHIAGLTAVMRAAYSGRRMVLLHRFDPRLWLSTVQNERITHAFVVPVMLKRLVDEPTFKDYDLSSLEVLSYGAAPTPINVLLKALDLFPKTVGFVNAYGQTETTSTVSMLLPEDHRLEGTPEEIERKRLRLRSIGRPLPDVQVRVVDEGHRPLAVNEVGEIALRTPRTMKGYLREEGDEIYPPVRDDEGWLYTFDLGWVDEDGYIFLTGRKSDRITRGGENIAAMEVESVLLRHPAVEDVAVVGLPDEEGGEAVVAFVVLKPEARGKVQADSLIDFWNERLASFKVPDVVEFVDELPRTSLGKVFKPALRERCRRPAAEPSTTSSP